MRVRKRHAGTVRTAQAVGAYLMRGLMLSKRRHRVVDIRTHVGLTRHEYYTAREHLIEVGCLHTRKRGMYHATRSELVRFCPVVFFTVFARSDPRELSRVVGMPFKSIVNRFPEIARHALDDAWVSAFEEFQRIYPRRDRPIPFSMLLGDFARACARYGVERVLEVARKYRAQQDRIARETNGRSGTGTRWVKTVERFLTELPQLERKLRQWSPAQTRRETDSASMQRAVGFLRATYGVPVVELRRLLKELPQRIIDDINDPMTRRTIPVVFPTYESFREHCLARARVGAQSGLAVQHPPPESADSGDSVAQLVAQLVARGFVDADDAPRVEHACRTRPALFARLNLLLNRQKDAEIRSTLARI
jgi:hypothetical protein